MGKRGDKPLQDQNDAGLRSIEKTLYELNLVSSVALQITPEPGQKTGSPLNSMRSDRILRGIRREVLCEHGLRALRFAREWGGGYESGVRGGAA